MEHILEVMFGYEHVIAEFFWNGVFIIATYIFGKARALRQIHKYIDKKHGMEHEEGN